MRAKRRGRTGTDQDHSLGGPVVVAVGPWPVGDLEGHVGQAVEDWRARQVEMAVADPGRREGSDQRRRQPRWQRRERGRWSVVCGMWYVPSDRWRAWWC